jgi:hypothetical protein
MKTLALAELKKHAKTKLWPFPDRMQHLNASEVDFNTEIEVFYNNLIFVFSELEDNLTENPDYDPRNYAAQVIDFLQKARDQVNQFFRTDTPANNDYNKKLQQIEAEGVSETPGSNLTPADSVSATKLEFPAEALALYLNKICLWAEQILASQTMKPSQPEHLDLQEVNTIDKKLLLLKYTGAYELFNSICGGNITRTAALIAAITGEKISSIRIKITYLQTQHAGKESSPYYKIESFEDVLTSLRKLRIDTKKADADYLILLSKENKEKL